MVEDLEALIAKCIKRDRHSQSRLYNLFSQSMFTLCLRYSASREEAEDVLQEGFIRVFEYLHQYTFSGSFEGWIRKIMVNCALQKYRSKTALHAIVDIEDANIKEQGNEDIISQIGTKELMKMVQKLPPMYRLVFNLYVFEGMKHREIALELGVSEGTSKSNLYDARMILQRSVNKSMKVAK